MKYQINHGNQRGNNDDKDGNPGDAGDKSPYQGYYYVSPQLDNENRQGHSQCVID